MSDLPPTTESGSRDTRLVEHAIEEPWPIPERLREALASLAREGKTKPRELAKALREIVTAQSQKLEQGQIDGRVPAKRELTFRFNNDWYGNNAHELAEARRREEQSQTNSVAPPFPTNLTMEERRE